MIQTRRRLVQGAIAAASGILLPASTLRAQSNAASLVRAPKQALVIGNSKYRINPLKNPANDARAMGETLQRLNFQTVVGLEWSLVEMNNAIRAFADGLNKSKAVGLFYFAGHGAQLAWRNYALPVDAEIDSIEELRSRCVDINTVIDGMRRAGNPMNIVILDACRDNPTGNRVRPDQSGLSQIDAPPGTLLAYATAPGNTAIDGDGAHGLYTEHLLREIKEPETKVEDVFKRVRLAVRKNSRGQQVPWESTSLEEDFWFIPPIQLRKKAEAESEREYGAESALWERVRHATHAEPLIDYLMRYPSGRFSELAQLQLDRVLAKSGEKKIELLDVRDNPYTKGTVRADTSYKIGDSWTFVPVDTLTRIRGAPFQLQVIAITDHEVICNDGYVNDLLGNRLKRSSGEIWSANQVLPTEFIVGKRWSSRFVRTAPNGQQSAVDVEMRIVTRENVTVPAGTFNAFRVDLSGWETGPNLNISWNWKVWYAPDQVRRPVITERLHRSRWGTTTNTSGDILTAFSQK